MARRAGSNIYESLLQATREILEEESQRRNGKAQHTPPSLAELERRQDCLKHRVLDLEAVLKANNELGNIDSSTNDDERTAAVEEELRKRIDHLREAVWETSQEHSNSEQLLSMVQLSYHTRRTLFPMPNAPQVQDTSKRRGSSDSFPAGYYSSPESQELLELCLQQSHLVSDVAQAEQDVQNLQKDVDMLKRQCEALHLETRSLEIARQDKMADTNGSQVSSSSSISKTERSLKKYRLKLPLLQHMLQSLIVGSGIDWAADPRWCAVMLDAGQAMKEA